MQGELVYSYDVQITGMLDYGIALGDVLTGQAAIPQQGLRFDVAFAGAATGRLAGQVTGTDFLYLRADGRFDLDIHATIVTADGARIALHAGGVALGRPGEPVVELAENVTLQTAAPAYAWVLSRQIWGVGHVNLAAGTIHVDGYMQ
ncbi:MAG: DUF3237 family protein [Acidobacteria bacterium]|nr:DUF3237 family protein [Acidobacteriota bacterium]